MLNRQTDLTENDTHLSPVLWCLRVVVFLQCLGVGGRYFFSHNESESDVYGLLFFDSDWPEQLAQRIDDGGTLACFASGFIILFGATIQRMSTSESHRTMRYRFGFVLEIMAALFIALWMLTLASTHMLRGAIYAEWSLAEHAVRIAAPIVLLLLSIGKQRAVPFVSFLLATACAATFTIHGDKAIQCYGPFTDLVLLSNNRFTNLNLEQSPVETAIVFIGIIDVALAILLITTRWRWVPIYMALWGFITAASRMTATGWGAWPETFIRAANGGAPLALLLLSWCCSATETPATKSTADQASPPSELT